jgi:hypothetical protein
MIAHFAEGRASFLGQWGSVTQNPGVAEKRVDRRIQQHIAGKLATVIPVDSSRKSLQIGTLGL